MTLLGRTSTIYITRPRTEENGAAAGASPQDASFSPENSLGLLLSGFSIR